MDQYIYNQIEFLCRNYCNNDGELLLNIADEYEDIIRNGFKPNDYGITNINDIPLYLEWGVMLYGFFLKDNKVLALVDDFHTGPPEPYEYELKYIPIELLELAIQIIINENHEILDYMEQKRHYTGLTDAQVLESRRKNGANVLTPPEKEPLWKQFLEKFGDPLIIILMIAGALSIGISCYEFFGLGQGAAVFFEPVGIFVAILLATGLAFYFELQADKEFTILNQVNDDEPVEVIRNGNTTQIPRKDIVVGDIVILNTGEEVPADSVLLEATSLHMDESTLTGEPMCGKSVDEKDFDKAATYPTNHVMKGTKVMEGHGICRVLAVGDKTEQGKVFEAVQIDDSVKTPLNEQLDGLSDWITKVSYGFAALIVIGRIIMYFVTNGTDCFGSMEQVAPFIAYVLQTLMIAVTLVVVAVPEGLPMAVTLSLAYSMRRMLKTNNLVRKMHACETMGATTVICTDKTGTLTQNLMSVDEMKIYGDTPKEVINEGITVNSTASIDFSDKSKPQILGNPTEGALLLWLNNKGVDYRSIRESVKTVAEVPFSTERKYMATIVESVALKGKKVLYVKGAPEIVFGLCKETSVSKEDVDKQLTEYQNRAMRTLGFAYQVLNDGDKAIEDNKIVADKLCFIGVAAIADPVRQDVPSAVKECVDAGISVKIVTGDTPGTAKEIARQIGLWNDAKDTERNIITGPEFAALSDTELQERILDLKIISRARPMDKKRLVETLQKKNQVVAVTGDGTNDAPALRAAHVGLSMGDGTSVAKEASDITIIDNSFSSIGKAVMWGRSLYQNIQRFLLFQLTVNVTACFLVLCGAFMGTESPLTVTQMLWINLIMDTFAAMALASLPPSESVMKDKPRDRKAFILNKPMLREIIGVGGFFFLMLLGMLYIFQHAEVNQLTDLLHLQLGAKGHVSTYELTLLFTTFVMTHFFYLFNARAFETGRSALHFKGCNGLLTIVAIILVGQIAMVELPGLQQFFNVEGLKLIDWVIIIIGSSFVLWVREIWHLLTKK
ncbi:calcium-translocating P-type ATPase, PMCA-type [uncultured Prevotella sp.]|mgnify:FL=1|uniref:calcium-translocating P-type ATPase, PMCA-type n=1 Tax=uncultured Prevotella sp. TaxID=159272 RepID=UPI00338E1685